jgi:hypothetical protein
MVYLITCSKTRTCKIGYASTPQNRLSQLQVGNPFALELVATMPGEVVDEKLLHKKFEKYRLKGEWFEYNSEIKEYFKVEDCYLMYQSMIQILKESTDVKLKLFASLVERYSEGQEFSMTKSLKEVIALECGCKPRSFDSAFTVLVKDSVVVRVKAYLYKINPRHTFKGEKEDRNKNLKAIIELGCKDC